MSEKLFTITERLGFANGEEKSVLITIKESELTEAHKNLYLGELLNKYDNMPKEVQIRFMKMKNNKPLNNTFENSLQIEWDELNYRFTKLQTSLFDKKVPKSEIDILSIQFNIMYTYLNILTIRMKKLQSNNTPV